MEHLAIAGAISGMTGIVMLIKHFRKRGQPDVRNPTPRPVRPDENNPLTDFLDKRINISLYRNICVVGPQNSGKTTLLRFLHFVVLILCRKITMDQLEADNFALLKEMWRDYQSSTLDKNGSAQPTEEDDERDPTPYVVPGAYVILWDMPGGGTAKNPSKTYVDRMGMRHMSSVLVVVGRSDTEVVTRTVKALRKDRIPMLMAQTHFDVHVASEKKSARAACDGKIQWTDDDINGVIARRKTYLQDTYGLKSADDVFCVNLAVQPEDEEDANRFEKNPFELWQFVLAIFDAVDRAHSSKR